MQVCVKDFPELAKLCWNRPQTAVIDGETALALYERNWRFVDTEDLTAAERELVDTLVATHGNGVLNV
jgi:hypothetical protein